MSGQAQVFGVSGGLINASVLAVAQDFDNLYMASLETARVFVRSCRLAIVKSRAIEDGPGSWGCVYVGIPAQELRGVLVEFQQQMVSKQMIMAGGVGKSYLPYVFLQVLTDIGPNREYLQQSGQRLV